MGRMSECPGITGKVETGATIDAGSFDLNKFDVLTAIDSSHARPSADEPEKGRPFLPPPLSFLAGQSRCRGDGDGTERC